MNRELKFKGWNGKRMTREFSLKEMLSTQLEHNGLKELWLQWTGLRDRNGVEIYEGDVIKFHYFYQRLGAGLGIEEDEHEMVGEVYFDGYGYGIKKVEGQHWAGYTGYSDGEGDCSFIGLQEFSQSAIHEGSFEVIGNTYQNPELLKYE